MDKRIALITGAARGIGKAILKRMVTDNYLVVAVDIDEIGGKLVEEDYGVNHVHFIKADICKSVEVTALMKTVISKFGKLDVLINNAGIIRDNLIWNMPEEDFDTVIQVNLKGVWLLCKEAAQIMKEQQSGRIINITSRAWLGNRGQSNYAASKAGIVGLTRVLALELGKYNVLVNAVAPGLIETPLTQNLEKEVLQRLIDAQPTRTMGQPQDIANAVAFLANEQTRFITGQTLYVDGGKSIGAGS